MGTARTHCPQSVLACTSALYHLRDKMARIAYAVLAVIALCLVAESQAIVRSLWGGWGLGLHGLGLNYGIGIGMPWGLGYGLGHGWGLGLGLGGVLGGGLYGGYGAYGGYGLGYY